MKLPHPADPGGNLEGALPKTIILAVLVEHKVKITPLDGNLVRLELGEILETQDLPEMVHGWEVHYLARKFGFSALDFYGYRQRLN